MIPERAGRNMRLDLKSLELLRSCNEYNLFDLAKESDSWRADTLICALIIRSNFKRAALFFFFAQMERKNERGHLKNYASLVGICDAIYRR